MKTREARDVGGRVAAHIEAGNMAYAYSMLAPVLAERTPFKMLGYIGEAVGKGSIEAANEFLSLIAAAKTEGGWVVIGSALKGQMNRDLSGAFTRGREYIIYGDIWYAADIISERVPGPALVTYFKPAMDLLAPWREDSNRWVRRAVGIGAHFWAKRSRGAPENLSQAETLLSFLESMFEEWELDVVKGVGWGLKTLGKYYPELVANWLAHYVIQSQRRHRSLMLRKALTYLSDDQRARAMGDGSR